jgi:hypothetical protein
MSNVQTLLTQKMSLERRIEQARIEDLERQRRLEAERLALQNAEIAIVRENMKNVMKKYSLTEDQILNGPETLFKMQSNQTERGKKLSLQEMRTYYANM